MGRGPVLARHEAEALVETAGTPVLLQHMQHDAATLRHCLPLDRRDQCRPQALAARMGKQADIDDQVGGRGALQVETAQGPVAEVADGQKVRVAVALQVVPVLGVELLVEEVALLRRCPRHRRHFVLTRAGVELAQPVQVLRSEPAQACTPCCQSVRHPQRLRGFGRKARTHGVLRGKRDRHPAAQCRS